MAFWKQALLALILLAGGLFLWLRFDSSAVTRLAGYGIDYPFIASLAGTGSSDETAGAGKTPPADGGGHGRPGRGRATLVQSRPVENATLNDRLNAIGNGMAVRTVTVTPTATGTLTRVSVASGDRVEAGQNLARIDQQEQRIAADKAELTLDDARKKLERYRELKNSSAVTSVQISDLESEVRSDELALKQAQVDLDKRTISAPISGIVGIVDATVGDYVTTETQIVTIDDRSEILVDFRVPERFAGAIEVGTPVEASAVARPGSTYRGRVSAVDNRVEQDSRTLKVRARIPNDEDRLRAGMSFSVSLKFPGDTYPAVNPLAVQWDSSGAYVWKVDGDKAERVGVRVVQRNPETVLVDGGLANGDEVVTEGIQQLRPGADVRFADADETEDEPADPSRSTSGRSGSVPPVPSGKGKDDEGAVRQARAKSVTDS